MADAEARKIRLWANTGDRENPEEVGLDRAAGWPVQYEQIGSGFEPERTIYNQLLRELSAFFVDRLETGISQWDENVNYLHPAYATTNEGLFTTLTDTGPRFGNPTDPTEVGQTIWRKY